MADRFQPNGREEEEVRLTLPQNIFTWPLQYSDFFFAHTAENESSEERRTRKIQDCVPMQDCAMQDCAASHFLF